MPGHKCDVKRLYSDRGYANYPFKEECLHTNSCERDTCLAEGVFRPYSQKLFKPVKGAKEKDGKVTFYSCSPNGYFFNGKPMAWDADSFNTIDYQWCAVSPQSIKKGIYKPGQFLELTYGDKSQVCKISDVTAERFGKGNGNGNGDTDERIDVTKAIYESLCPEGNGCFKDPLEVKVKIVEPIASEKPQYSIWIRLKDNHEYRYNDKSELENITETKYWPIVEKYWEMARFIGGYLDKNKLEMPGLGRPVLTTRWKKEWKSGEPSEYKELRIMITDINGKDYDFWKKIVEEYVSQRDPEVTYEIFYEPSPTESSFVPASRSKLLSKCGVNGCEANWKNLAKLFSNKIELNQLRGNLGVVAIREGAEELLAISLKTFLKLF